MMPSSRQAAAGYTLTEILVVAAIMSILAAATLPSMRGITEGQQTKTAGFEIYAALTATRSEAIKRNDLVTITPIGANWANGWNIVTSTNVTLKTHSPLKGVVVSLAPASLVFNRNGRIQGGVAARFQIDVGTAVSNRVRCVRTELSGMPRIIKGAC